MSDKITKSGLISEAPKGMRFSGTLTILSILQILVPCAGFTAELNLGSTDTYRTVDQNQQGTVSLVENGQTRQVGAGAALTGAEYAAFVNATQGHAQTLNIGAGGVAVGGTLNLTPQLAANISGLVVPSNVTVIHDFGLNSGLNLTGNLVNSGTFYAISTNSAVTNAVLSASNLTNNQGAVLTSVLPTTGLAGITGAISNLSLTLNIMNSLTNMGTISSAGNLNINAGAIYNQLPATGISPIMQAVNNLNLNSTLGNITNQGILAATTGNVNLTAVNNLVINNVNGSIQALVGNINIHQASDILQTLNINATGGDWLSHQLNIDAGCGVLEANVNRITGQVNVNAGSATLGAATPDLNLGNINISGDPTWFNTAGNVLLSGPIVATGASPNIAILASGDIISVFGATVIDSSSAQTGSNAGAITLLAGANFSAGSGSGTNDTTTTLTINGGSATGGGIYLDGTAPAGFSGAMAVTGITAAGTGGNNNGGNVTMVSYAGSNSGSGVVRLPAAVTVTSGGSGNGLNGAITIIAGATNGAAISTGGLLSSGSTSTPGTITLAAATPAIDGSGSVTIIGGAIQPGSGSFVIGVQQAGAISTGTIVASGTGGSAIAGMRTNGSSGGDINIRSLGDITTGALRSYGGGGGGGVGPSAARATNGGNGGTITINSGSGNVTVNGEINVSGGGGGGGSSGNPGLGGSGGSISIASYGAITIAGPVLAAGGGIGGTTPLGAGSGGSGGGGSFGGGGGGASGTTGGIAGAGGGGGGGGGYTSGGGGGGGSTFIGGGGGGGGYGTGGGGGGGGARGNGFAGGGGGGGGGGIGLGGGGGGGGESITGGGGAGGAGGTDGTAGTAIGTQLAGPGGSSAQGGAGSKGGGGTTAPFGDGGSGGAGGAAGSGTGAGSSIGDTGGSGSVFGVGGGKSANAIATVGGDVGSSGNGGTIALSGRTVVVNGTIGTAAGAWPGFATSPFAAQSISARGGGGSITVNTTAISLSSVVYSANADYASTSRTAVAPVLTTTATFGVGANFTPSGGATGSLNAGFRITLNGSAAGTSVVAGTFQNTTNSFTLREQGGNYTVTSGSALTPAELVALVNAAQATVGPTLNGSGAVGGAASGGIIPILAANIPAGNFTNLNLPANVIANVSNSVLTITGPAVIAGTLNFSAASAQLDIGTTTSLSGAINFNGGGLNTFTSGSTISGAGTITGSSGELAVTATAGNIGMSGTPLNFGVMPGVKLSLTANAGSVTVGNLVTAGRGGDGNYSGPAGAGGNGGDITIQSMGDINTGSLRAFGGGGGGGGGGGAGGTGGTVSVSSTSGSITVSGEVNTSGGGGGGGAVSGAGGTGGNQSFAAAGSLSVTGPLLAAGGGRGGAGSFITLDLGAGGGGSFGGGGGSGPGLQAGGGGGGGYTGGGGGGGGRGSFAGGGGGGGPVSGGGGGGGSAANALNESGAGGGGGGIGLGGGGAGLSFSATATGGSGGAGGETGAPNATGAPGVGGPGGAGANGSGTGGPGQDRTGTGGGRGGAGGTTGSGTGTGGIGNDGIGGAGGVFGIAGGKGQTGTTDAGNAGTGGAAGSISLTGQTVTVTGTIGSASGGWVGFASSPFAAQSINAQGTGGTGTVTITATAGDLSSFPGLIVASNAVHLRANNIGLTASTGPVGISAPNVSAVSTGFTNISDTFSGGTVNIVGNPITGNSSAGSQFTLSALSATALTTQKNITADTISLFAPTTGLLVNSNLTATQNVNLNANNLTVNAGNTVSGANVIVQGLAPTATTVQNFGNITATTGNVSITSSAGFDLNIGGTGTLNAVAGRINLTANTSPFVSSNINVIGNQNYNGQTFFNAPGSNQSVFIASGVVSIGNSLVLLTTPTFNEVGDLQGNPLVFATPAGQAGTIANSLGNIDLNTIGNLTFIGQSLALLAAGNIINTGGARTINLSTSNNVSAGSLTLIAGFNFNPPTPGGTTGPVATPFSLTTASTGNISLSNVTINTSASASNGGSLLAVANGAISLGAITTTGVGMGGAVTVIGNSVTTGAISSSGAIAGAVSITASPPVMATPVTVTNGRVTAGSFTTGVPSGNITFGAINAGSASITLTTGGTGFLSQLGTLTTSGLLTVNSGSNFVFLNVAASRASVNTTTGSVLLNASGATNLDSSNVGGSLSLSSSGIVGLGAGATVNVTGMTSLTGTSGISFGDGSTLNSTGGVSLLSLGATSAVTLGNGVAITSGTLAGGAPASPAGLTSANVLSAGSIMVTAFGSGGLVAGANSSLTVNGGNLALNSYSAAGKVDFGNNYSLQVNGGMLSIYSGGQINLGPAAGTAGSAVARTLNGFAGTITSSSTGNTNIGGFGKLFAGTSLTVNSFGLTSAITFNTGSTVTADSAAISSSGNGGVTLAGFNVTNSLSATSSGALTSGAAINAGNVTLNTFGVNQPITVNQAITVVPAGLNTMPTIALNSSGNILVNGILAGNRVNLSSSGNSGAAITLAQPINGSGVNSQVTFNTTSGAAIINNVGATSTITANVLNINAGGAVGVAGSPATRINTSVDTLNLSGFGAGNNVAIDEQNTLTLGTFGSANVGGSLELGLTAGNLTFQSINAGNAIKIVTTSGNITQLSGGYVFNQTGGMDVSAIAGGSVVSLNGSLFAGGTGAVNVTTTGTISAIGSVTANNGVLTVSAVGGPLTQNNFSTLGTNTGNIFVSARNDVLLNGSVRTSVSGNISVTSALGTLTLANSGSINATSVTLSSPGAMTLNGMVSSRAGMVDIAALAPITINQSVSAAGGVLSIVAINGALTTGSSALLSATGGDITLRANNAASGNIVLGASVTASGTTASTIAITSARAAALGSVMNNTTGNINITANVGTLQLNGNIFGQGDVNILHKGIAAGDRIVLSPFVSIFALAPSSPQGNISIAITNGPVTNIAGVVPAGGTVSQSTSGTGQIFFGPGQFTNSGFTTLIAKGANIRFFRDATAADGLNAIQLNSNFLYADPPSTAQVSVSAPGALSSTSSAAYGLSTIQNVSTHQRQSGNTLLSSPVAIPNTVQGFIDVVRPLSGAPSLMQRTILERIPATDLAGGDAADPVTQAKNLAGAILQSGVTNANAVLTGFVAKKASFLGRSAAYIRCADRSSVYTVNETTFDLERGEIVLSASRRTSIKSGCHSVDIAPGAIVHIVRDGDVIKVRSLCDTLGKAVHVMVAGKPVRLSPGEELVIGTDSATVNDSIAHDKIGRREVHRFALDNKYHLVKSELSVIGLIQRSTLLSTMYSKGTQTDRNLMERVMKMAAALFQVTGKRGAYSA